MNTNDYICIFRSIEDTSKPGLGRLQGKAMFKDIRGEAEEQIYIALILKIDEFLDLAAYDWMLAEPQGTSSSYVTDLIAFLNSTFTAFTNLPVSVRCFIIITVVILKLS